MTWPVSIENHLPGKHDQKSHGRGKGTNQNLAGVYKKFPPSNIHAPDSMESYMVKGDPKNPKKGDFTPEREALHDEIIANALKGKTPVDNPRLFMTGGGPASGKSTIHASGAVPEPKNHVLIDPDGIKKQLPEYEAFSKGGDKRSAAFTHEESSYLSKRLADEASRQGYNIHLDGTGDSGVEKLQKKIKQASRAGQPVEAHYVNLDTAEAIRRSDLRAQRTGRVVPHSVIEETHANVSKVVPQAIKAGLYDKFTLWDNNVPKGSAPIKVAEATGSNLKIHNQSLWNNFVAKGE